MLSVIVEDERWIGYGLGRVLALFDSTKSLFRRRFWSLKVYFKLGEGILMFAFSGRRSGSGG